METMAKGVTLTRKWEDVANGRYSSSVDIECWHCQPKPACSQHSPHRFMFQKTRSTIE